MNAARIALVAALALHAAAPAQARTLPVDVLPWPEDASTAGGRDSVDLAGGGWRAGGGWWALACDEACRLEPLRLAQVKAATLRLESSGARPGQHLRFAPAPPPGTLLLLHPRAPIFARHPLQAGPVPSGHPVGDTPSVHEDYPMQDNPEVTLDVSDGQTWTLAATLLRPAAKPGGPAPSDDSSTWPISLDLKVGRRHQSLGLIGTCGDIGWRGWLLWTGDLDGDGKPDLVVQLDLDAHTEVVLYLSSLARRGQWVGEAGHSHLEGEGEC